ncbi:NADH-quinone oxidoreductase subunit NuoH [bacterium]|nr:NADH-quinone oxidoreductase subunit NuoH [bacterium]
MLEIIGLIIKISIVVGVTQGAVAYLILVERKIAAFSQDRIGPNRVGPLGLLQPIVDGVKMFLKEDVTPNYVNKPIFILAPFLSIVTAMIGFAVVPFGPVGPNGPGLFDGPIQFQIAPGIDIGLLYIFAVGSLAVYGVILAGYSSNNKYSFLGGLRSSAQIISYEIPMGLSVLGIVLLASSLDLNTIIQWQDKNAWGIFVQPLGFFIFLICAFAETNRLPFDLPESEQELVGGFHTEYSSMKFGMFFLGEYLHVITVSFLVVILYLGGWDPPFVSLGDSGWLMAILKVGTLITKVLAMIVFVMWIRWTLPRFRYDRLMELAWKRMIPLAIGNTVVTALILQLIRR